MPKENKSNDPELVKRLQQAQALLDECIAEIQGKPSSKSVKTPTHVPRSTSAPAPRDLDFDANERAFVKAHARGLSGPKKFVLLVAYLAKGKIGTDVELKE